MLKLDVFLSVHMWQFYFILFYFILFYFILFLYFKQNLAEMQSAAELNTQQKRLII
jgi:hypothetical protein